MRVKWHIEHGVLNDSITQEISNALSENNIEHFVSSNIKNNIFADIDMQRKMGCNEHQVAIPYGSVNTIEDLKTQTCFDHYQILAWNNKENFSWGALSAYWSEYLLNSDHVVVSLGHLQNKYALYYDMLGKDDRGQNVLFVKPFENNKGFSAMPLMEFTAPDTIGLIINQDRFPKADAKTLAVVSSPKDVVSEWRFMICNSEIVGVSQYSKEKTTHYENGCDKQEAHELVAKAIDTWEPDFAYSLDICEDGEGDFWIMEAGIFNCSSPYAMDKNKLFGRVTEIVCEHN